MTQGLHDMVMKLLFLVYRDVDNAKRIVRECDDEQIWVARYLIEDVVLFLENQEWVETLCGFVGLDSEEYMNRTKSEIEEFRAVLEAKTA